MARVRILSAVEGYQAGQVVDLPGEDASRLADGVRAVLIRGNAVETPERDSVAEQTEEG